MTDLFAHRYQLLEPLGRGGSATAWLAQDWARHCLCVVKRLRGDTPELSATLIEEFSVLSDLAHPSLVEVWDFGFGEVAKDGSPELFYTAKRVEGVSLLEFAASADTARLSKAVADVLDGLHVLHEAGLRHGDIKSENILVNVEGRAQIIDFGCADRFPTATPRLGGTHGYLAPELLEGGPVDGRADLYALGVTLKRVRLSAFSATDPFCRLIEGLAEPDVTRRISSAREALERLSGSSNPHRRVARRCFVGRDGFRDSAARFVDSLRDAVEGPRAFCVWGNVGSGRSRAMTELCRRAQSAGVQAETLSITPKFFNEALARHLRTKAADTLEATMLQILELARSGTRRLFLIDDIDRVPEDQRRFVEAAARVLPGQGNLALAWSCVADATADVGVIGAELLPLERRDVATWAGSLLSTSAIATLVAMSGGNPALVKRALDATAAGEWTEQDLRRQQNFCGTDEAYAFKFEPRVQALLADVLARGVVDATDATQRLGRAPLSALLEDGWLLLEQDGVRFASPSARERCRGLPAELLVTAHRAAAERLRAILESSQPSDNRAGLWLELAEQELAAHRFDRAAEILTQQVACFEHDPSRWANLAESLLHTADAPMCLIAACHALIRASRSRLALTTLARTLARRPVPALRAAIHLAAADCMLSLGQPTRARRELVLAKRFGDGSPILDAVAPLEARALLRLGQHQDALEVAAVALPAATGSLQAERLTEVIGLASGYAGEFERAKRLIEDTIQLAKTNASPRALARAYGYLGIVEFRAGQYEAARAAHEQALEHAQRAGLDDLAASSHLNLGTVLQQLGQLGAALTHYERGHLIAHALGRRQTELLLGYNLANLYAYLGQFERSNQRLSAVIAGNANHPTSSLGVATTFLDAELGLVEVNQTRTAAALNRAEALLESASDSSRELIEFAILRLRFELGSALLEPSGATLERFDDELQRLSARARATSALDLAAMALCLAARSLRQRAMPATALDRLNAAKQLAISTGQKGLLATVETEIFVTQKACNNHAMAMVAQESSRLLWLQLSETLEASMRDAFLGHPERATVCHTPDASGSTNAGPAADVHRLLQINKRLNSSLSVAQVLTATIDAAIELTLAERGFVVVAKEDGGLAVEVARNMTGLDLDEPEYQFSRSIAQQVVSSGVSTMTLDATSDRRFSRQESVHAMQLRSVLCVPIASPSGVLGALYLDNRAMRARFDERARDLLTAFADQAALALTNARLHERLAERTRALELEKRRVEILSQGQQRRIEDLTVELSKRQTELEHRYDYSQIVAHSSAMHRVFDALDRITEWPIDVLVTGESGTGKELVARALHFNGPRKLRPFVTVNCAALPDNLLEAELFGHVRGAFTGADRDREGLFVAASGGTLFLDEVGEMAVATQARLLRVLQEREVRPLGSSASKRIDVRVVSATNRSLRDAIQSGQFREDLFYRLAVVEVALPPLRERREDILPIAKATVERVAKEQSRPAPEFANDAVAALMRHPYPGNIRELSNVITRAVVLCSHGVIRAVDLELTERNSPGPVMRTRRDFERHTAERYRQVLAASGWNISEACRLLGVPRNTFYRHLKRFGIELGTRSPDPAESRPKTR